MDTATLVYDTGREEFIAFNQHHLRQQLRRRRWVMLLLLPLLGMLVAGIRGWAQPPERMVWLLLSGAVLGLVLAMVVPVPLARLLMRRMLNGYAAKMDGFWGRCELSLVDDGLVEKSPAGETKYAWKVLQGVTETAEQVFIHVGPVQAIVVAPAKVVSGDLSVFLAELRARMQHGGAAGKRKTA